MNIDRIVCALQSLCPAETARVEARPVNEVFVTLPAGCLVRAVEQLFEHEVYHLSTITGQDTGSEIQLLYHFWDGGGLTVCISLPRRHARIDSLIELIPGAAFYEREIAEMFDVMFDGHPDMEPLLLPDDWDGGAPLRDEGGET
jgi:NADH-quinone oxidoreductase subunit C